MTSLFNISIDFKAFAASWVNITDIIWVRILDYIQCQRGLYTKKQDYLLNLIINFRKDIQSLVKDQYILRIYLMA